MLAGIDTHKDTLAVAVIDPAGRPLIVTDLANTEAGFDELEALLADRDVDRVGIEGSGNYGRGAAVRLVLAGGIDVVEVPPSLTSRERSSRPGQGRQDRPVDALAIARITARETTVLYTMAITQIRADTEGRTYYLRKRAEGKTTREALRCLKRRDCCDSS